MNFTKLFSYVLLFLVTEVVVALDKAQGCPTTGELPNKAGNQTEGREMMLTLGAKRVKADSNEGIVDAEYITLPKLYLFLCGLLLVMPNVLDVGVGSLCPKDPGLHLNNNSAVLSHSQNRLVGSPERENSNMLLMTGNIEK